MTTRKNFWWWVTDASLVPTNLAGAWLNVLPNLANTVKSAGNKAWNVINRARANIIEAFTRKPFKYKSLEAFQKGDGFVTKRKKTWWNFRNWLWNGGKYAANVIKQITGWALALGVYGTAAVVWAPVWAVTEWIKWTVQSVAWIPVDAMNTIQKVWQQWDDDKGLPFTKVLPANTISYTEYVQRNNDTREKNKSMNEEIRAAKKAIKAKYANWGWTPAPVVKEEPKTEKEEPVVKKEPAVKKETPKKEKDPADSPDESGKKKA